MPAPACVALGLQLRLPCGAACRGGRAAARRAPRPARASEEPEKAEERIYVAPNWIRYPLPGSPAGADALSPPPPVPQAAPPSAGLARLSRADAASLVMSAVFGMGAPLPGAEQARPLNRYTRLVSAACALRSGSRLRARPQLRGNAQLRRARGLRRTRRCRFRCLRRRAARASCPSSATSATSARCAESTPRRWKRAPPSCSAGAHLPGVGAPAAAVAAFALGGGFRALARRLLTRARRVWRATRSNADCLVYHKLVDNLGLFHELQVRLFKRVPLGQVVP